MFSQDQAQKYSVRTSSAPRRIFHLHCHLEAVSVKGNSFFK